MHATGFGVSLLDFGRYCHYRFFYILQVGHQNENVRVNKTLVYAKGFGCKWFGSTHHRVWSPKC